MSDPKPARPPRAAGASPGVVVYVAGLVAGAAVVTGGLAASGLTPPGRPAWPALPVLVALVVAAERLAVRFRYGTEVNALNLVEAAMAPLLFAFPGPYAVAAVAVAHAASAFRNAPIKVAFNVAQWALATAIGASVVVSLSSGGGITGRNVAALLAGLAAVLVTNQVAFTLVISIANNEGPREALRALSPVIAAGWLGGWLLNVLIGLLYVLAYAAHPAAVVLFGAPLAVLHLAYRGYAAARTDRHRLGGLHQAATLLAAPLDPRDAVEGFLGAVAECFEAPAAELVLRADGRREIYTYRRDGGFVATTEPEDIASLAGALAALPGPTRVSAGTRDPLGEALAGAGWRECAAAPLLDEGRLTGALLVFDQAGVESSTAAELAVLDALARETANAFAKGRLLASVLEERRKLEEIVGTTSDGLLTLGADGTVRSWNPALERITGLPAAEVVGRADVLARLAPQTVTGAPVDLAGWAAGTALPAEVRVTAVDGGSRRLACSYSQAVDPDGAARTLVVVARDVTPVEEMAALRAQFQQMVEAEAAQRFVVEHLQQTVMPARPEVRGADLAVAYLASDPTAPTGGDLYDWQVLPNGEVHVAVVDVLGHGVAATKDALAVVHTLRTVAVDGTPLEDVVARAGDLLTAQNPELVATVIVGRFDPRTGVIRVVAGGHPPALVVAANGEVTQLAASGGAIGWPGAGSDTIAETTLGVGDALVLYTDGLVEARKNILDGMDELMRHANAVASRPTARFAHELLDRALSGAERRDDSLVLVLRRTPVAGPPRTRTWSASPQAAEVTRLRREVVAWLAARRIATDDAALVVSELLANAVRAARSRVTVRAETTPDEVVIEVSDDGTGAADLVSTGVTPADLDAERGRGLFLVRAVTRDLTILSTGDGSIIRAVLANRDARPATGSRRTPPAVERKP